MPAICRGDNVDKDIVHCSVPKRLNRSSNVFVNGIGISRLSDVNDPHLFPGSPCPTHQVPITSGSKSVFINGLECGRIGDPTCTAVATGSANVFAGG